MGAERLGAQRSALLLLSLAACAGDMRMLDAKGVQAERLARLFMMLTAIATVVFAAVMVALAAAAWRGRRRARRADTGDQTPDGERRLARGVGAASAVTLAILFVYHFETVRTGRELGSVASVAGGQAPLTIEVIGHQWWWEFRYRDTVPSHEVYTANELHIPVGRAVRLQGTSRDVIHSFWVPNLHGKRDLIPGHVNTGVLRADTAGTWTGECGEFCGHQHAKMRFVVVAEPRATFNKWYEEQLRPAAEPADSSARHGRAVFLNGGCVLCHQINGTPAGGRVGPNLTHLASRQTIAAGTLPNTRGHLAGWVVDPQRIKPGAKMPPQNLSPNDLNALLDYLRSLR